MPDEPAPRTEPDVAEAKPAPAPAKGTTKKAPETERPPAAKPAEGETPEAKKPKKAPGPKAPRRPTLDPELGRLLTVRGAIGARRPKFVRTASHRYWRIGRWASWRRPRGLQSKQRRHYGYRPVVVSVGFRSPCLAGGVTPTGFAPVLVHTTADIEGLERTREAAVIARSVGTRRRLVLEETARKLGVRVLNPIATEEREE